MEQECEEKKCKVGVPDWMVTFSDLMTLLLTFFVLLLSMAENATPKIETGILSIREAFAGKQIIGDEKSEFSPIDSPVPVNRIQKSNSKENNEAIEVEIDERLKKLEDGNKQNETDTDFSNPETSQAVEKIKEEAKDKEMKETGNQLQMSLDEELKQGMVSIKSNMDMILIRLPEEPTFKSGKADLSRKIKPALRRIAETLKDRDVDIVVAGYTDDRPIRTARFRSNWDLSSARSVSVAHELIKFGMFAPEQLEVVGHGEGYPLFPNDSPENRALNRRVEINIDLASASITEDEIIKMLEEAKEADGIKSLDSTMSSPIEIQPETMQPDAKPAATKGKKSDAKSLLLKHITIEKVGRKK